MVDYNLPTKCLKCGQQLFALNGMKVLPQQKQKTEIFTVLLYCNECRMIVAECIGNSITWYVKRE